MAAALSCNTCTLKRASSCEGFAVANCQVFTFTVRPLSFGMRISAPVSVDTDHSCCIVSSTRKTVDLQARRIEVADVDCVLLLITNRQFWSKELFILMCRTVCQIVSASRCCRLEPRINLGGPFCAADLAPKFQGCEPGNRVIP